MVKNNEKLYERWSNLSFFVVFNAVEPSYLLTYPTAQLSLYCAQPKVDNYPTSQLSLYWAQAKADKYLASQLPACSAQPKADN